MVKQQSIEFWKSRRENLLAKNRKNSIWLIAGLVVSIASWFNNPIIFLFSLSIPGLALFNIIFNLALLLECKSKLGVRGT